jgi:tRNA (guanosine-2'-O-)-methyltransferase
MSENHAYQIALRDYLMNFISDNKQSLFKKNIEDRTRYLTIVLENIYQSHNASAVIRSCDLFGVHDVHIIENTHKYELSEEVAMGSSKWLKLKKYNNLENNTLDCFNKLRAKGYQIIATTPHHNDVLIEQLNLDKPIALVFGTEHLGLSETALNHVDGFMKIPMYGFTESFNISVSAALSMFYLTEKLRKSDIHWQLSAEEKVEIQIEWARKTIKKPNLIIKDFEEKWNQANQIYPNTK